MSAIKLKPLIMEVRLSFMQLLEIEVSKEYFEIALMKFIL